MADGRQEKHSEGRGVGVFTTRWRHCRRCALTSIVMDCVQSPDRVECEVRRIGVPGANLRSNSSRPLGCEYAKGTSCVDKAKSLNWNRGVPMASRRGQNSARGFLFNTRFAHAACHCFNSGTISTQGLLSCTIFIAICREGVTWNTGYFRVFGRLAQCSIVKFSLFSAALRNFIFSFYFFALFFCHIFTFHSNPLRILSGLALLFQF